MSSESREFSLQAVAIVDRQDKLLFFKNYHADTKADADVQAMLEASLDLFEAQMEELIRTHGLPFHGNVGLVQRVEGSLIYGRELANQLRLLVMVQAMFGRQPSEAQMERVYQRLITTCANELSNPFRNAADVFAHPTLHVLPDDSCFQ